MKLCLGCEHTFNEKTWKCPACLTEPTIINGFYSFSPNLEEQDSNFNPSFFKKLMHLEAKSFWFKSRNKLLISEAKRFFPTMSNYLEIGCGTGFILSAMKKACPNSQLQGSELFIEGLTCASERLKNITLYQMDARFIPFANELDLIGAFDVLEHIKEDNRVLEQMYRAVRPGGGIIISVPQHMFLWSIQDEYACHVRRYNLQELKKKVQQAGFNIEKTTSFVSLLFPLMLASRFLKKSPDLNLAEYDPLAELKLPFFMNTLFNCIMLIERILIKLNISFPFGGSLLLIARK